VTSVRAIAIAIAGGKGVAELRVPGLTRIA